MKSVKSSISKHAKPSHGAGGKRAKAAKPLRRLTHSEYESKTTMLSSAPVAVAGITRKKYTRPVTIDMTEEVSDVAIDVDFANSPALINPANSDLFPWMSQIAEQFTSYYFKKLNFRYVPSSSSALGGTVAMAVNANPNASPFDSVKQTLNHEGAATCAPWESISINALTASNASEAPYKQIADTTGIESIFDDLYNIASGVVQIITAVKNILTADGKTATDGPVTCGKLFVDYTVVLMDPTDSVPADDGVDIRQAFDADGSTSPWPEIGTAFPGDDSVLPLGTSFTWDTAAGLGLLTFKEPGVYQVAYEMYTSSGHTANSDVSAYVINPNGACLLGALDGVTGYGWQNGSLLGRIAASATANVYNLVVAEFMALVTDPSTDTIQFGFPIGFTFGDEAGTSGRVGILLITKVNNSISSVSQPLIHKASCPGLRKSGGVVSLHRRIRQSKAALALQVATRPPKEAPRAVSQQQLPDHKDVKSAVIDEYVTVSQPVSAKAQAGPNNNLMLGGRITGPNSRLTIVTDNPMAGQRPAPVKTG